MKTFSTVLFTGFIFCFLFAQNRVYSQHKSKENKKILHKHDQKVQKIIKSDEGVLRGFSFGIAKDEVRKKEDARLEAETEHALIYKVEVGGGEYADVIYMLDEDRKIKAFSIAFVIKTKDHENTLIKDMTKYYSERYGDYFTDKDGDEFWVSKEGYKVELSDSSSDGFIEIEIEYSKN